MSLTRRSATAASSVIMIKFIFPHAKNSLKEGDLKQAIELSQSAMKFALASIIICTLAVLVLLGVFLAVNLSASNSSTQ